MPEETSQPYKTSTSRNAAKSNGLCDLADKGTIQTSPLCSTGEIFSVYSLYVYLQAKGPGD